MMTSAILVTGDTYTNRRAIKALGGKWNKEEGGWLVPTTTLSEITELAGANDWTLDTIEIDEELLETPTGERLRAIRQDKIDRRASRLEAKANRLGNESARHSAHADPYRGDISYWTQPNINSSGGRSFTRQRERVLNHIEKAGGLAIEAANTKREAEWLRSSTARIAGDAEARRQAVRDYNDGWVTVGIQVETHLYQTHATVTRINKKTYSIELPSGFKTTIDKSFVAKIRT
jgi:hypothetical protein